MSATASWPNQGEVECFTDRCAIPREVALTLETYNTISLRCVCWYVNH